MIFFVVVVLLCFLNYFMDLQRKMNSFNESDDEDYWNSSNTNNHETSDDEDAEEPDLETLSAAIQIEVIFWKCSFIIFV